MLGQDSVMVTPHRRGSTARPPRPPWLSTVLTVAVIAVLASRASSAGAGRGEHEEHGVVASLWGTLKAWLAPRAPPATPAGQEEDDAMVADDASASVSPEDADDVQWVSSSWTTAASVSSSPTKADWNDGEEVMAFPTASWVASSSSPPVHALRARQDGDNDPEAVSLAFVFDSTGSMHRDLEQLKRGATAILAAMLERPDKPIHDYVFVPFNDPGVGPAMVTTNPDTFRAQLEAVQVHGGSDCPEPSLSALLEALQIVRPNSYIYVFTDASAKDYHLLPDVLSQVQRKQTQVVFVMTGNCNDGNTPRYQSMENVAAASSGQIYHINKTEVENVLSFVRKSLDSQKVNLVSVDLPEASKIEHALLVDETIREFTVSVSGENPQISVKNPEGIKVEGPPALQNVLDLDNVKVVAVKEPVRGSWTVETSSDSKHAVRLTGLSVVDFSYGFSAYVTDRLDETYHRPLQGAPNFILVGGSDMGSVWNLTSVDLLAINGSTLQSVPLSPLDALDGLYRGGPFIPPGENELFYLANVGYGIDGYPIKRITPTAISAQAGGLPSVQLQSEQTVWLNSSLTLRCQIDSLVPFTAWFSRDGLPISKKQKYLQTALMIFKIDTMTEEMSGNYVCYASNLKGHSKDSLYIVVTGPPPEVITDSHLQVLPQHQVILDCFIQSKLRYNSTWIRTSSNSGKDAELVENNARYILLPNSSLVIDPALPEDTGLFSCVAESQGGRRESKIELLVNDPLQIIVKPEHLTFVKNDSFSITCEAVGTLPVKFYWEREGHILQIKNSGRLSVEQVEQKLILSIKNAKLTDQGVYRCVGSNKLESAEGYAEVYYVEIPSVFILNKTDIVRAGNDVSFMCQANGSPRPKKRWLWQGINVESLPNFEVSEEGALLIYSVHPDIAGQLDCVAQNSVGEVKDSVNLTVGDAPVATVKPSVLYLEIEGSGILPCSGSGIPRPSVRWERQDGGILDKRRIQHDIVTGALIFTGAELYDEGAYNCILENYFGQVVLDGKVIITGIVSPTFDGNQSSFQNIESTIGKQIELSCSVSAGKPIPKISWYKDGFSINLTSELKGIHLHINGSLIIDSPDLTHSGVYKCEVTNIGGSASRVIQLTIMDPPTLENSEFLNITGKVGSNTLLSCLAHGVPQPDIQWLQGDNSPIALTERIFETNEGLFIVSVQVGDAGLYKCLAVNGAGSANRSIMLMVEDPPQIVGETVMEISANIGDILRLPCNATGEPLPKFRWSHNNEDVIFNDHILPSTNSDGLVITSVEINDAGEYQCTAINNAGVANKTITISVQEIPVIDASDPAQVTVISGQLAKLTCKAKGIPAPQIIWTFRGQPISANHKIATEGNGNSLILPNVQESDSGSYMCTAYNVAGSDARAVKLVIFVMPTIDPWPITMTLVEGQDLLLKCPMSGTPQPKGIWYKDGVVITPTNQTDGVLEYKVIANLSNAGQYKCKASNEIGTVERSVEVIVIAPPRTLVPSYINLTTLSGKDLQLHCLNSSESGYPSASIEWTCNGCHVNATAMNLSLETNNILNIQEIRPFQSGIYECKAQNEAGLSSRTFNVSVQEFPRILSDFPKNKTLLEGEDFSLPCLASGIPEPLVFWKFNNQSLVQNENNDNLLLMNDNTLVIISARANISGLYTCTALNEVGEDRQHTFVEVHIPPSMTRDDVIREEVNEGDDVELSCPTSNSADIEWKQNGKPIDFTANERSDEAHFKLLDGGKTLAIFESRPTDNGTYTCTASNAVGQKRATFYLEVLWAPFFEEFGVSQKVFTVLEGSSITFDCLSNGSPTPKVIWKVNDSTPVTEHTAPGVVVLPTSRHFLTIPIVRAHHDGLYRCQAINRVGHSNRQFLLHVVVPPYIENDVEDHYEVLRGDTVTLFCPVLGSPKPSFTWRHSNGSDHFQWDREKFEFHNNSQILVIPNIDFSDGGVYICNGSNQADFRLKHFNVSIMGLESFTSIPEAPTIFDTEEEELSAVEGGTLSLDCTAHGQPLPDIQWTHNGHTLSPDTTKERFDLDSSSVTQTITIDFTGITNAGKYVCHATNNQGAAEKVYRVRFQASPQIEGGSTSDVENVTSVHGLPLTIHCTASGEPVPTIKWEKDGSPLISATDFVFDGLYGGILHIKHTTEQHSGNYTCIATNSAGSVSKTHILDVLIPPFHPNNTEEIRKNVLRHSSLILHCNFSGHPNPKLLWIKGIYPIAQNHSSMGIQLSEDNQTLEISSVEMNHAGRYSCLGTNEAGSAELMFHVQVSEPPQRNEAVTRNFTTVTLRPLRRFMLLCAMSGSPLPTMTWFKDGVLLDLKSVSENIQISADGRQLHILNAHQDHEGLYQCHAENIVGSSDAFFQLIMDAQGEWGEWSDWNECSVTCGPGSQERKRECLNFNCVGEKLESRPCFVSYCPVDGGWSNWTDWVGCDQQCGPSNRSRTRKCNNPQPMYDGVPCVGAEQESENCDLPPCPIHGGWSPWSEWTSCSVTCGYGVQIRHRLCSNPIPAHGGQECVGNHTEIASCNENPCSGIWSDWSEWTPCSSTCGSGMRQRQRKCLSQWTDCVGDNKQFEYCKLRRCIGDGPRKAHLRLRGHLNGHILRNDSLFADISGNEQTKRGLITTRLRNIHKREASIYPVVPLLVSPVSWNIAYEEKEARNGYSLTKGFFSQNSQVHFATGQEMKMKHVGEGVDAMGQLQVDIEVIGEVPYLPPKASIVIQPFSENIIQTGKNTLYKSSDGSLSADGYTIPYSWNSTLFYKEVEGAMPYLSEKMSTDNIFTNYDSRLQEMQYTVSSVITKSFQDNKCPEGFKLNEEHQHCEDIDECSDVALNRCHSTQLCENLLGSYRCSCPPGFRSLNIGTRCLDVNECLQEPPLCSHDCRNIPGSYYCMCPPGTYLVEDRHSCSGLPYWDDPDETYGASDVQDPNDLEKTVDPPLQDYDTMESSLVPQEFRVASEEWSCAEGLVWQENQCKDLDECFQDPDICGEDETCLNMYKTFQCLYTPCSKDYKRDPVNRDCIAVCSDESPCPNGSKEMEKEVFIAVTVDPESNEPGLDLVHLSVSHGHLAFSKLHTHTKYYISNNYKGNIFSLRQEIGKAVIYAAKRLKGAKVYRVGVQGDTFSDDAKTKVFSTRFSVFFHVLQDNSPQ